MSLARFLAPILAAWLLCLATGAASQAALPPGVQRVTSVEGITEYAFPNGLRAVLVPDASKPTITVNIVYLVGSRHEGYGETGMAHLLEHLLFKGTAKRPTLNQEFAPRAARRNGTTWYDRTNYYESFPATPDNLQWALEMEADRMVNSNVARADLDSEMTVVRNEYERGENEPARVLSKRMGSIAFDWHNYGNSAIGNRSDIENVAIDNLRAFYRTYYQPDNAVLVVAGHFDEAQALGMIAAAFGPIPKPTRALPKLWTVEPTQDGERSFAVRRRGGTPIVSIAYKIPGALHDDAMAADFAARVLAQGPSSRLHRLLVEGGKAVSVSSSNFHTQEPGLVYFNATLGAGGNVEEVQKLMTEAIESFGRRPPSVEELGRVKTSRARQHEQTMSSAEAIALALTESAAKGDWRTLLLDRQRAQEMRAAAVSAAARKYFVRDNRTVGVYLPTEDIVRAEIPAAPSAQTALKDFKGEEALAAAEAFDPSPANIDKRTTLRQLPSGLKVALLPKKTRGATVNVRLVLRYGDVESLRGRIQASAVTGAMLMRGAAGLTRQQLADRLAALKISGSIGGGVNTIRTTRENLPDALRLMTRILREPDFPPAEFEQLRSQMIASFEQRKADVNAIAQDRLNAHFNAYPPDDPRYIPSTDEAIQRLRALTLDDVRAFHRDFYGASHGEIAIVGDFDEKEVMAILERELGGWKSPRPHVRPPVPYREVAPLHATVEVPDKANAAFLARLLLPVHGDDPEYPALQLANYLLGGGAGFGSRLNARIRQREGLSYGVSSSLATNRLDRVATVGATASFAPENAPRLEGAFREEMERLYRDGFTEAEVEAAKAGLLQTAAQQRSNDEALAAGWTDRLHRGRTYAESAQFDDRIRALTRDEVNAVVKKHLDPARISTVKAGTFAKAP